MKSIKTFVAVSALSMMSFGAFAQSVSATASTLIVLKQKLPHRPLNKVRHTKSPALSSITVST